jgi:hypothetical protein
MKACKVLKNPLSNIVEVVTDGQTDGHDEENMLPPEGVDIIYHYGTILLKEERLLAV